MNDDEVINEHLEATGKMVLHAMRKLRETSADSYRQVMLALNHGCMLRTATTTALSGLLHINLDLVQLDGSKVGIMSVSLDGGLSERLN